MRTLGHCIGATDDLPGDMPSKGVSSGTAIKTLRFWRLT